MRRIGLAVLVFAITATATGIAFAEEPTETTATETTTPSEATEPTETTGGQPAEVEPAAQPRSKIRNHFTKHVRRGGTVRVRGFVEPVAPGRKVEVQLGGREHPLHTGKKGGFHTSFGAGGRGTKRLRIAVLKDALARGRTKNKKVHVYRGASASWYGPGLYGNRLACGGTLRPSTLGVAHKRLPCGSKVRLRYHGRGIVVRVIDRGPFVGDREFDLTAATKRKLRFPSLDTVWTTR